MEDHPGQGLQDVFGGVDKIRKRKPKVNCDRYQIKGHSFSNCHKMHKPWTSFNPAEGSKMGNYVNMCRRAASSNTQDWQITPKIRLPHFTQSSKFLSQYNHSPQDLHQACPSKNQEANQYCNNIVTEWQLTKIWKESISPAARKSQKQTRYHLQCQATSHWYQKRQDSMLQTRNQIKC